MTTSEMKINAHHLPPFSPTKAVDFSYLEKCGSRDNYAIPTCFSKCNFQKGQTFEARTTHIYDPSKFWIVTKFRELSCFQKCLFRFYYINRAHYKIPENKIQLNIYCVAFADNAYYRGVIIGFPDVQQEKPELQIYFFDYGMVGSTGISNIYYIAEKFMEVPQFALRASLARTCPLTNSNWTPEVANRFYELVVDKVLVGVIINVDPKREVLEVHLSQQNLNSLPIHEILIKEKYARHYQDTEHANGEKLHHQTKLKHPYLFPSHEVLESGKLPLTASDAEYQLQIAPLSSVLSRYYKRSYPIEGESSNSNQHFNHRNGNREKN